jgi:hypothetical protein
LGLGSGTGGRRFWARVIENHFVTKGFWSRNGQLPGKFPKTSRGWPKARGFEGPGKSLKVKGGQTRAVTLGFQKTVPGSKRPTVIGPTLTGKGFYRVNEATSRPGVEKQTVAFWANAYVPKAGLEGFVLPRGRRRRGRVLFQVIFDYPVKILAQKFGQASNLPVI